MFSFWGEPRIDKNAPPNTLKARDLDSLATYIKDGKCKKIVVMSGAGISTSAGIPDFRSPDTGLYANLARLNLPHAEAVFEIGYFRQNPRPFYELASELFPGKFRPTITHSFINLLHKKGLLLKHFTQNIDCLDREAGLPGKMTIEAHGSFATHRCIDCKKTYPDEKMREMVQKKEVPHCPSCNSLVKPDIVFFGEALPAKFFEGRLLPTEADLCIVMGTSLTVGPFNQLPNFAKEVCPRLLINKEQVGNFGSRADDVLLLEDCDAGVKKLAEACGWLEELEEMWAETGVKFGMKPKDKSNKEKSRDKKLEDEIESLTKEVDETLKIANNHEASIQNDSKSFRGTSEISESTEKDPTSKENGKERKVEDSVTVGRGDDSTPTAPLTTVTGTAEPSNDLPKNFTDDIPKQKAKQKYEGASDDAPSSALGLRLFDQPAVDSDSD